MRYREQRLPCDTEVAVPLNDGTRRVRFVNISTTGAQIEGLGPLPRDALVVLRHLGKRYDARVVWANDKQAGLNFARPLSPTELVYLRGTGGPRSVSWTAQAQPRFRELT